MDLHWSLSVSCLIVLPGPDGRPLFEKQMTTTTANKTESGQIKRDKTDLNLEDVTQDETAELHSM